MFSKKIYLFVAVFSTLCILGVKSQRINNGRQQVAPVGSDVKDSYDLYLQQILKQRNSEAQSNPNNNNVNQLSFSNNRDNINFVSRVPSSRPVDLDESPITSNPVRFFGVPKTDVEQLNNITYAITTFGIKLMRVSPLFSRI